MLLEPHDRREDHVQPHQRCALEQERLAVARDLPHGKGGYDERADEDRTEHECQVRREREREQHERGEEERGDLRDRVFTTEIERSDLPFLAKGDPDYVLDRVPRDRDNQTPVTPSRCRGLDRQIERGDEPVRDERRPTPATASTTTAGRTGSADRAGSACASSAGVSERR